MRTLGQWQADPAMHQGRQRGVRLDLPAQRRASIPQAQAPAMKALTIWQPWASLIIAGAKPVEWRSWRAPRWIIGQRIAIHAGARAAKPEEIADILERLDRGETSLVPFYTFKLLNEVPVKGWPLSSVLGTALLGEPVPAIEWIY